MSLRARRFARAQLRVQKACNANAARRRATAPTTMRTRTEFVTGVGSAPDHGGNQHCVLGERVECIDSFRRRPRPNAKGHAAEFPLAGEDALRFAYGGLRF